jgi:hypothetical protein
MSELLCSSARPPRSIRTSLLLLNACSLLPVLAYGYAGYTSATRVCLGSRAVSRTLRR